MHRFYLFEAGSTKTVYVYVDKEASAEIILPGFNPNRNYNAFKSAIEEGIQLEKHSRIIFYGSGLASEANKKLTADLFAKHEPSNIKVYDDILGAARATYGNTPGVVAILGTGGLAAAYNGKKITARRGGYGYLIDDLGGGFELGKQFLALWLNGDLKAEQEKILHDKLKISKQNFTKQFYQNPDLDFVASLVPYVLSFKDEPVVNELVLDYFNACIKRNILPLCKANNLNSFAIVGSVGFVFYQEIRKLAKKYNLTIDMCVQNPIQRLIHFHS